MPTILRVGAWRFFFYSNEGREPPHVHVETPQGECKFWLTPVRLATNRGVQLAEIGRIRAIVLERAPLFRERWYDHFA
jgi:hypothetical protein